MAKSIQQWFDEYGESHQNPTNKIIHWICIPLIFWSIIGLLACIRGKCDQTHPIKGVHFHQFSQSVLRRYHVGITTVHFLIPARFDLADAICVAYQPNPQNNACSLCLLQFLDAIPFDGLAKGLQAPQTKRRDSITIYAEADDMGRKCAV